MHTRDIYYKILLKKALGDWPSLIQLSLQKSNLGTKHERYHVTRLYDMEEDISEQYIDTPEEVLMVNLHASIYEVIHGLALFCTEVNTDQLRGEEIQRRFERRLISALKSETLDWLVEDKSLIQQYFAANNGVRYRLEGQAFFNLK